MFKKFVKFFLKFLICGLIWLFIFSISIGNKEKVFDFFHFYIVNTKPIHWMKAKLYKQADSTSEYAKDKAEEVIDKVKSEVKK